MTFDDPNLVANAGLLVVATLVRKLGLEDLCDKTIGLMGRTDGFRPGRKTLTLVHAMVAGATHIDHADMLRAGSTASVLEHTCTVNARDGPAHLQLRSRPPVRKGDRRCPASRLGSG